MKLELPLALGLLAVGCWLFLPWPEGEPAEPGSADASAKSASDPAPFSPEPPSSSQPVGPQDSGQIALASGIQPDTPLPARQLLQQAASQLREGPPVQAQCRLRIFLFDQRVAATGQYLQGGQGSGLSQLRIDVDSDPEPLQLIQTTAGNVCYRQTLRGDSSELEYYDLNQIADDANRDPVPYAGTPTQWLGMGGLPGLLDQLAVLFDFEAPETVTLGDIPMWRVRGTWKPGRLKPLLSHYIDSSSLNPEIDWDRLPPQLPRDVELYLGQDDFLPRFPYRIVFHRHRESEPMLNLELHQVKRLNQIDKSIFEVQRDQEQRRDITHLFTTRLEQYRSNRPPASEKLPQTAESDSPDSPRR